MKDVSVPLKPVVWLLATLSLMLLNAADCAFRPLTAVFIAPSNDMGCAPGSGTVMAPVAASRQDACQETGSDLRTI